MYDKLGFKTLLQNKEQLLDQIESPQCRAVVRERSYSHHSRSCLTRLKYRGVLSSLLSISYTAHAFPIGSLNEALLFRMVWNREQILQWGLKVSTGMEIAHSGLTKVKHTATLSYL